MKVCLCCAWFACGTTYASDQQVIVQGGQRAGEAVRTSGHAVPLLRALEQVVPTSYSVIVPNAGAWADVPVSWHPGSLVHVLGEILSANPSLQARVDTDLRLVTVTAHAPLPAAEAAASSAAGAASSATAAAATNDAAPPVVAAAAPAAASSPQPAAANASGAPAPLSPASTVAASAPPAEATVWQMRTSDGSVRNALSRWADEAGWQFIWDVPTDFTIDATATIHGTLEEALHRVVEALSHSQVPIQVVLYKGNHVLRVIPKGAS